MASIIDSYSESNQDTSTSYGGGQDYVGQSFTGDGGTLNSAVFYLKKTESPDGNMYAHIYAHTGTFGTSSIPTGSPLATSDAIAASSLSTSFQLISFTFSGVNKITITNGTKYVVVLETNNSQSYPNYIDLGDDNSSPTHAGNYSYYQSSTWYAGTRDLIFYVYKDDVTTTSTSTTSTSTSTTSTSTSTTVSVTTSTSTSTTSTSTTTTLAPVLYPLDFLGVKISKPGVNVLETNVPNDLVFSSRYGTLKYALTGIVKISTVIDSPEVIATALYNHNLGYFPYFEVYVSNWAENYEPVPILHTGASTSTQYNVYATKTQLKFRVKWTGYTIDSTQTATFKFFIFKNDLGFP